MVVATLRMRRMCSIIYLITIFLVVFREHRRVIQNDGQHVYRGHGDQQQERGFHQATFLYRHAVEQAVRQRYQYGSSRAIHHGLVEQQTL